MVDLNSTHSDFATEYNICQVMVTIYFIGGLNMSVTFCQMAQIWVQYPNQFWYIYECNTLPELTHISVRHLKNFILSFHQWPIYECNVRRCWIRIFKGAALIFVSTLKTRCTNIKNSLYLETHINGPYCMVHT